MVLFRNTAFVATTFVLFVIMLGSFTRLADAGLGCPDWPGCYGHLLWPDEDHEIVKANEAYPDMPVDTEKTWPEMVHRYLASSLGLFGIALAVMAFRFRGQGLPFKLPIALLGLIIIQGLFGMWTVTLKLWPQVVTTHLMGGFLTFCTLLVLSLRLSSYRFSTALSPATISLLYKLSIVGLIVVVIQILLGGWTTSNYAALACADLPKCQNQWLPPTDFKQAFNVFQHIGPNYLGGLMDNAARVAIHLSHRIGAIVVCLVLLVLIFHLLKAGLTKFSLLLAVVLTVQIALGLSNIIFHFPIMIAVAHNLGGALLAGTLVFLLYSFHTAKYSNLANDNALGG